MSGSISMKLVQLQRQRARSHLRSQGLVLTLARHQTCKPCKFGSNTLDPCIVWSKKIICKILTLCDPKMILLFAQVGIQHSWRYSWQFHPELGMARFADATMDCPSQSDSILLVLLWGKQNYSFYWVLGSCCRRRDRPAAPFQISCSRGTRHTRQYCWYRSFQSASSRNIWNLKRNCHDCFSKSMIGLRSKRCDDGNRNFVQLFDDLTFRRVLFPRPQQLLISICSHQIEGHNDIITLILNTPSYVEFPY